MLRRYVQMDEEDAECQLGVDMAADVVTCEVPFGSVLFLNNLIPHRWPEFLSKDHLGCFSWKTVVPRSTHACLAHPACIGEMGECKEMPCTEQNSSFVLCQPLCRSPRALIQYAACIAVSALSIIIL